MSMVNTIVPIAGQRAKYPWRTRMSSDPIRVEFQIDRDPRLIAAVRAAVQFQATHAGMDVTNSEQFGKASEELCREVLLQLSDDDGGLEVVLQTFDDRMEISIQHHGEPIPAVGLETFTVPGALAGRPGALNGVELLECVDRVVFDTQDGIACTTLVKFLPPKG